MNILIHIVLPAWLTLSSAIYPVTQQDTDGPMALDRTVKQFVVNDVTVPEAVIELLKTNHLLGGIISTTDCSTQSPLDKAKYSLTLSGMTMRQALDEIVSHDNRYQWQQEAEAIILMPARGIPDLLKTRIGRFEIDNPNYTLTAASGELLQLVEIRTHKNQLGLKEGPQLIIGGVDRTDLLREKVSVSNVSMYDALNAIGRAGGGAVWRYSEYHCGKDYQMNITWMNH